MPIIDFTNVEKVYRGSVEMKKVYEGSIVVWEKPAYFYIQNEHAGSNILTLTKNGSALTTASDLEYSLDETNWTQFDLTQASSMVTIPQGGKVYMRSTTGFSTNSSNYLSITTSEDCSAGGNIMSLMNYTNIGSVPLQSHCLRNLFYGNTKLIDASDLQLPRTTLVQSCYDQMFHNCTSLTQAPVLPATTLASSCYSYMFSGCTSLTQAPVLPATTMTSFCYENMFHNCTSLTQAPVLPATTLASSCYSYMFMGCTSLTQAPTLPATTLAMSCYRNMFYNCTSLTQAPTLPATTLAMSCYFQMFQGCTSLTQAPALPATTLTQDCYNQMFRNCTSLKEVWCYAQDISASSCITNWLYGVANDGALHKPIDNDSFPWKSASGVPSSWHVVEIENKTWGNEDYFRIYNMSNETNTITIKFGFAVDKFPLSNLKYSTDYGQSWIAWDGSTGDLSVDIQGKTYLLFKDGTADYTSQTNNSYSWQINGSKNYKVSGDIGYFYNKTSTTPRIGNLFYRSTTLVGVSWTLLTGITSCSYRFNGTFNGCTNLVQAPNLPLGSLKERELANIFTDCTSLKFIRCTATNMSANYCLYNWVLDVPSSGGVFIKRSSVTWPTGTSGIPSSWTVVNI